MFKRREHVTCSWCGVINTDIFIFKGPRECSGHKLEDSPNGSKLWKCTSRNPDNKNPHLTKRCKLKCKKGKARQGHKKVYCKAGHGWVERKGEKKVTPGTCS